MNKTVTEYLAAFASCYPQHRIEVKPTKGGYRVLINDDPGDKVLTLDNLREATAAFKQ